MALHSIFVLPAASYVSRQEVVTSQSVWEFLSSGGMIMIPIAICSIVALAFFMERYLNLKESKVLPDRLNEAIKLLTDGKTKMAWSLARDLDSPASRVLQAGLRRCGYALQDVERGMEDQAQKEMNRLRDNIRPLTLVANISPLLGLLGTVIGIQNAFQRVKMGLGKPAELAEGIETALVTTIAGLFVAIPALLLAAYLSGKVRKLMERMDEVLAPTVEKLAAKPELEDAV